MLFFTLQSRFLVDESGKWLFKEYNLTFVGKKQSPGGLDCTLQYG